MRAPFLALTPAVPTVTGIDARYSDTGGGKTRRITGTLFTGATAADVLFGATPATSIVVSGGGTIIDAVVPAHAAGNVTVSVFGVPLAGNFTFWNLTVPATPTSHFTRPNYVAGTWTHSTDSLGANLVPAGGPTPAADPEGVPLFDLTTENLQFSPAQGLVPLIDSDTANDCTIAFVVEVHRIATQENALPFNSDQIFGDNNYRGHLGLVANPNCLRWYWYEGAYQQIECPIPFVGIPAAVGVSFTSNGGTGDTITIGGAATLASMGFAAGQNFTVHKAGATNDGKSGTITSVAGNSMTVNSNIVTDLVGAAGYTIRIPSTSKIAGLLKRSTTLGVTSWAFSIDGGATWVAANPVGGVAPHTSGTTSGSGPVFFGYTAEAEFSGTTRAIAFYKAHAFTAQEALDFKGWADAEYT